MAPSQSLRINQRQKQALVDNLQLEVAERARKLRAQYVLQAQSLRSRIEMRVNRIPSALRQAIIGELLQRHARSTIAPAASIESTRDSHKSRPSLMKHTTSMQSYGRGLKRKSHEIAHDDKENTPDPDFQDSPKKMHITSSMQGARGPRPASAVLSPKSGNSRPASRPGEAGQRMSPFKTSLARPTSPLKPYASPARPMGSGTDRFARRPHPTSNAGIAETRHSSHQTASPSKGVSRVISSSSAASGTSTGTTVVRKIKRGPPKTHAPNREAGNVSTSGTATRKTVQSKGTGSTKRALKPATNAASRAVTASAVAKKGGPATEAAPTTTRTGRVLRKRN